LTHQNYKALKAISKLKCLTKKPNLKNLPFFIRLSYATDIKNKKLILKTDALLIAVIVRTKPE
jgi:hypothetical protein